MSSLNFGWSIIPSLNKGKLKELYMSLNELVNDQKENSLYLQWYLGLTDQTEMRLVNKQDTPNSP